MEIGRRVRQARESSNLTQDSLARHIGIDRSAVAKIENDMRKVSAVELAAIAEATGRRIEWFVLPEVPAIAEYRESAQGERTDGFDDFIARLVEKVAFVAEEIPNLVAHAPLHPLPQPHTMADAETLATQARRLLKLPTDQPATDLPDRLASIGLIAVALPAGDGADGATILLRQGGVAIINTHHRDFGRQRLTLAHELGHYLVGDSYTRDTDIANDDAQEEEAHFDRFARAFLLPRTDLTKRWKQWMKPIDVTLREAAVRAASHYQVDMATLARRLMELKIIDPHQAVTIRRARTRKSDIIEMNLVVPIGATKSSTPFTELPGPLERAILTLFRQETITRDRALDLLLDTYTEDDLPDINPKQESARWAAVT